MVRFTIGIADVNILINALYMETRQFFSDFITHGEAMETVNVDYNEIIKYKIKCPNFSDIMCEKAVLKYKIDKLLVNYNVFPIHASSLAYKKCAYLFLALSGVGKSTHSRKWCEAFPEETIMINDDRPYLKLENDTVFAYSHPQAGKHGIYNNVSFPVRVIAKIVRDKDNYVKEVKKTDFFPFMVQQSFTMNDPITTRSVIMLIRRVMDLVSFFEIHCNMDNDAAYVINEQMNYFLSTEDINDVNRQGL